MPTLEESLMSRWNFDGIPGFSIPAKAAFTKSLGLGLALRAKRAEIDDDRNLTPTGHQDKFLKHLADNAHELVRARKTAEKLKTKLAQHVEKLAPVAPDKSDFAGAVMRSEFRSMLRSMDIKDRMAALHAPEADPELLRAVLEMPNVASAVNPHTREVVTNRVIERQNPGALAMVEKIKGAVEMVDIATKVAVSAALETGGFPNTNVFDEFISHAVGDTSQLEADVERNLTSEAA